MARRPVEEKYLRVNEQVLMQLEGYLAALREMDARYRPKLYPVTYIANQLGIGESTVKEWLRASKRLNLHGEVGDRLARFGELFVEFGNVLGQQIEDAVWDAARDPTNRNGLKAATWLLPRVNRHRYGPNADVEAEEKEETVAGVPQEVYDELSDEQIARLEQLRDIIAQAMAETEAIVKEGRELLAARQAEEARARVVTH